MPPKRKQITNRRGSDAGAAVFSGQHLWVNHDAKNMRAAPHRHQVFSHIQRRYRPLQKRNTAKSNSALAHGALVRQDSPTEEELVHQRRVPSPIAVVALGNSDPFAALPVNIGPEENELIGFYRDVILPAQYGDKVDEVKSKDWHDSLQGLRDEGIAHGSLARWGYMLAPSTPRLYVMSMTHQLTATKLLRQKLATGVDPQTHDTYMHLNMLYSAETLSRNPVAARVHGTMLAKLFDEAWRRGSLDHTLLLWQVHNDVQTSAMFLEKTVFDFDTFIPMVLKPLKKCCVDEVPLVNAVAVNASLSKSIQGVLADFFAQVRLNWVLSNEAPSPADQSPALGALRCLVDFLNVGRAVNHYVRVKEMLKQEHSRAKRVSLLAEAFLFLAAVYMTRKNNIDSSCLGRPIFDIRPSFFPALKTWLDSFAALANHAEYSRFAEARVWALFCGAQAEQQYPETSRDPYTQCFNTRLAVEAGKLGLSTWSDLQPVLETFIYSNRAAPQGAEWFDQLMAMRSTPPSSTASMVE